MRQIRYLLTAIWILAAQGFPATPTSYLTKSAASQPPTARSIYVCARYTGPEDGSVERPYNTISEALEAAQEGDRILVAGGPGIVYTEMLQILKPVHLLGGYDADNWQRDLKSHETIISGDGQGTVVTIGPWPRDRNDIVFEGFTVQNGVGVRGGGISIVDVSVQILHNRISGNHATEAGGGIAIQGASPLLRENVIEVNSADGEGGGVFITHSTAGLVNNQIISNSSWQGKGGGILITDHAYPALAGNMIISNNAREGAGIFVTGASQAQITNSVIAFNTASSRGGGIAVDAATADIIHASIVHNSATLGGGIWASSESAEVPTISVTNSILWGHNGKDIAAEDITVRYSDIEQGLWPGPRNLSVNPQFADAQALNFRLDPASPLVDAGTNDIFLEVDFEGDRRIYDGDGDGIPVADIGADEVAANLESSSKRDSPSESLPVPGGFLSYIITLRNNGQVDVPTAVLTDVLPSPIAYRPASLWCSAGTCSESGGIIIWQGPLSRAMPIAIGFRGDISEMAEVGWPITNTAQVAYGADKPLYLMDATMIYRKETVQVPLLLKTRSP